MRIRRMAFVLPAAAAVLAATPTAAAAAQSYEVRLAPVNDSGATGTAILTVTEGGGLRAKVSARGLVPGVAHALHVHGDVTGRKDHRCPGPDRDANGDGIVNTLESTDDVAGIFLNLTTRGSASPKGAGDVSRMPVADASGRLDYERSLPPSQVPDGIVKFVRNMHVVLHGIDANGNDRYDDEAGPSELNPAATLEETSPANCGRVVGSTIRTMPEGGIETGTGRDNRDNRDNLETIGLFALGAALLAAAGAIAPRRTSRRRASTP
jgi:hypothetical protein